MRTKCDNRHRDFNWQPSRAPRTRKASQSKRLYTTRRMGTDRTWHRQAPLNGVDARSRRTLRRLNLTSDTPENLLHQTIQNRPASSAACTLSHRRCASSSKRITQQSGRDRVTITPVERSAQNPRPRSSIGSIRSTRNDRITYDDQLGTVTIRRQCTLAFSLVCGCRQEAKSSSQRQNVTPVLGHQSTSCESHEMSSQPCKTNRVHDSMSMAKLSVNRTIWHLSHRILRLTQRSNERHAQ